MYIVFVKQRARSFHPPVQVIENVSFSNTYWLCNSFEWDTMEYATRHLYFPYTEEPLGECVYEENTSDKWHIHCFQRESIA